MTATPLSPPVSISDMFEAPFQGIPSQDITSRDIPVLDLKGLRCPMPVLRTRKALRRMTTGACLTVLCTDPLAAIDIPHFLDTEGHDLRSRGTVDGVLHFVIQKGATR